MGDDQTKGTGKEFKGGIKEAAGKATGDKRTEAEGKADKTEGKAQRAWGDVKDTVKGDK
jgi:uncharacterized protein YjbJ (UPF0337 family)